MIDIRKFHSNLLKIDKKSHIEIDIYYIGYIKIKKFSHCENIHSVNLLYLIIHFATGCFKEKEEKNCFMKKNYARIGINTDDDLPLNEPLKCLMLTIIIRCVFQEGENLYPQIYLDECLCEL